MNSKLPPRRVLLIALALVVAGFALTGRFGSGGDPAGVPASPNDAATGLTITADESPTAAAPTQSAPTKRPTSSSATPTAPAGDGDDGAADEPGTITATLAPDVQEAATAFTAAWLNTFDKSAAAWRDGLLPRVTPDLAEDLSYAEPATVPAGGKTGKVAVTVDGQLFTAEANVVAAAGKPDQLGVLHLRLVNTDGTWLISEIDWEPKR